MNDSKFDYILENLSLYSPWVIAAIVWLIVGIGLIFLIRFAMLYSYGAILVIHDAAGIARKKKTLGDLILMKDIQTELEKEIEQAMMKATFHG